VGLTAESSARAIHLLPETIPMDTDQKKSPSVVYHLAGAAELRPAVSLAQELPATVNDLPCFYYWKDAITIGTYVHPTGGYSLDVTGDKLDAYVSTFSQMQANGVGVPILRC
jgi:hypothetical protein